MTLAGTVEPYKPRRKLRPSRTIRERPQTMLRSTLLIITVLTLTSPIHAHDWFSELHSPLGQSCCGENDCRPVESRYNVQSGQLELQLDRMWVPIDRRKVVREQFSPDGKYYACWRDPNYPFCFILPLEV